jgi:hypothetical protein
VTCHTPPLHNSNKLTLAQGFFLPNAPATLDILPISVGTDPDLALKARKGKGYDKVPSLKGVWRRGHYLNDGSLPGWRRCSTLTASYRPTCCADGVHGVLKRVPAVRWGLASRDDRTAGHVSPPSAELSFTALFRMRY